MPLNEFNKLNKKLEYSSTVITSFGGFQIESLGKIKGNIINSKKEILTYFEIVHYNGLPILGSEDCLKLQYSMNEINKIMQCETDKNIYLFKIIYIDVFSGLGKFLEKISIKLKKNGIPKVFPPRRVPYKIINNLKESLENKCKLKIIKKCNEPTKWLSQNILVENPDKNV